MALKKKSTQKSKPCTLCYDKPLRFSGEVGKGSKTTSKDCSY